jgi:hypothetical protein
MKENSRNCKDSLKIIILSCRLRVEIRNIPPISLKEEGATVKLGSIAP